MITVKQLMDSGLQQKQASIFAAPLSSAMGRYNINTPARISTFVGQLLIESARFTQLEENLNYRDPARLMKIWPGRIKTLSDAKTLCNNPSKLANRVYSARLGNGDEASGDGYKYRGRGLIQITGKSNYSAAAQVLSKTYIDQPDLVSQPVDACLVACWYWSIHKLNQQADKNDIDGITRAINGPAMLQAAQRKQATQTVLKAISS